MILMPAACYIFPRFGFGFTAFSPLGWLSIGLWSVVKQTCYIYCNISMEKFVFITVEYRLTLLHIINTLLIFIDCEHAWQLLCTQLLHVQKFMYNVFNTFFYIFRVSAISINFTLRSFKIILWTFFMFSSETAFII
jgi:hypothetical protein